MFFDSFSIKILFFFTSLCMNSTYTYSMEAVNPRMSEKITFSWGLVNLSHPPRKLRDICA